MPQVHEPTSRKELDDEHNWEPQKEATKNDKTKIIKYYVRNKEFSSKNCNIG